MVQQHPMALDQQPGKTKRRLLNFTVALTPADKLSFAQYELSVDTSQSSNTLACMGHLTFQNSRDGLIARPNYDLFVYGLDSCHQPKVIGAPTRARQRFYLSGNV